MAEAARDYLAIPASKWQWRGYSISERFVRDPQTVDEW